VTTLYAKKEDGTPDSTFNQTGSYQLNYWTAPLPIGNHYASFIEKQGDHKVLVRSSYSYQKAGEPWVRGDYLHRIRIGLPEYYDQDTVSYTICQGENITVKGATFDKTGSYSLFVDKDTLLDPNDRDTLLTVNLEVLELDELDLGVFSVCPDEPIQVGQLQYSDPGLYEITLQNSMGCDSILHLEIYERDVTLPASICEGSGYTFDDSTFYDEGQYQFTLLNAAGCDSTIIIDLSHKLHSDTSRLEALICEGENYEFAGSSISAEGDYFTTLTNAVGCDSVVNLSLSFLLVDTVHYSTSICEGEAIKIGNTNISEEGEYYIPIVCDSIVHADVTISDRYTVTHTVDICPRDFLTIDGSRYYPGSTYQLNMTSVEGCDSIVFLTVNQLPWDLASCIPEMEKAQFIESSITVPESDTRYKRVNMSFGDPVSYFNTGNSLYISLDWGMSWEKRAELTDIINAQYGPNYIFINAPVITLRSLDYGLTWTTQEKPKIWEGGSIFFIDENTGFLFYERQVIIHKTTNGGASWKWIHYDWKSPIERFGFLDADRGYKIVGINYYTTDDGGESWVLEALTTDDDFFEKFAFQSIFDVGSELVFTYPDQDPFYVEKPAPLFNAQEPFPDNGVFTQVARNTQGHIAYIGMIEDNDDRYIARALYFYNALSGKWSKLAELNQWASGNILFLSEDNTVYTYTAGETVRVFTVDVDPLGIAQELTDRVIYPVPAVDYITIEEAEGEPFMIYDMAGRVRLKGILSSQRIDIRTLAPGQYLLSIGSEVGKFLKVE
jgi:hypothetical protein